MPYNISQYAPLCIWNYFLSFALYFHKVFHFFLAHCRQLFNGNSLLHWLCSFFRFIIKPFAQVSFFLLLCCIQHIYYIYSALFLFLCAGFLFYWANPFAIPNSLICLGVASLPPSPASSTLPRLRSGTWGVAFEPHDVVNCDSSIMSEIYWAEAVAINGTELQAKKCSRAARQQGEGGEAAANGAGLVASVA